MKFSEILLIALSSIAAAVPTTIPATITKSPNTEASLVFILKSGGTQTVTLGFDQKATFVPTPGDETNFEGVRLVDSADARKVSCEGRAKGDVRIGTFGIGKDFKSDNLGLTTFIVQAVTCELKH